MKGVLVDRDYRIYGFIKKSIKPILFISAFFCLFFSVMAPIFNNGSELRIIASIGLAVFVIFHGLHRYGLQKMLVFIVITFIVSWTLETLSISIGFPFGNFYYTELLGVKAGNVPWGIMLAYFFTGYLAWTISGIFLNETSEGIKKRNIILVPLISAGLMVLWNLSFDPIMSTIEGNWVWESARGFHGVPFTNFLGWFLTTFISFQLFAVFLYGQKEEKHEERSKWFWYLVSIMLFIQVIEYIIHPFLRTEYTNIYRSAFWIAIAGIGTLSILSFLFVFRKREK